MFNVHIIDPLHTSPLVFTRILSFSLSLRKRKQLDRNAIGVTIFEDEFVYKLSLALRDNPTVSKIEYFILIVEIFEGVGV